MTRKTELSKTHDPLIFHKFPKPGKIEVIATKPLSSQEDLSLAYSPGVGEVCMEIDKDPSKVFDYTIKSNLVAVVTNGTAVLGFGDIGPLAAKPVMEGKGVLFKKFAGIDVFDIEINEKDPSKLIDIIASLEPTFGGINLEDIKAPECFEIEKALKERMSIPVFHDDQHGTAIIVAAGILNALRLVNKQIDSVKLVTSGAGAAALSCLDLLIELGLKRENVLVCDQKGVLFEGREGMDSFKAAFAKSTQCRTLSDALEGADIFLGLSVAGVASGEMIARMADNPIIFALANPVPEIMPEEILKVRSDAIIATGRSDYPNQINNVLCFPFLFRGALDVGASQINMPMKVACVKALADLVLEESSDIAMAAYVGESLVFDRNYIIPKPFDPRLLVRVATAVVKAAMDSGVATRPIADLESYTLNLKGFVYRSGLVMRPMFDKAGLCPKTIVFSQGEDERVLRAAHQGVEEGFIKPILIADSKVLNETAVKLNLKLDPSIVIIEALENRDEQAAQLVKNGTADGVMMGPKGFFEEHKKTVQKVLQTSSSSIYSLMMLILPKGVYFISGTHTPGFESSKELCVMSASCIEFVQNLGYDPKVALLSHSHYGSTEDAAAVKMRESVTLLRALFPDLDIDGEMHADAAVSSSVAAKTAIYSSLKGQANLLIMPSQEAAHISYALLKSLGDGIAVGPVLLNTDYPAQILTSSMTTRGILNLSALTVLMAQKAQRRS